MNERDRIEHLNQVLSRLEQMLDESQETTAERARGVALFIKVVVLLSAVLALSNLYFINDLTQEIRVVIAGMDAMTGHLDRIAARMDTIEGSVAGVGSEVHLMPVVSAQMNDIAGHVDRLTGGVEHMRQHTSNMHDRMASMNLSVAGMAMRFHALNQTIVGMGADVNQMARPLP
ncbi:MAG: hypothetical protein N838_08525 [Thiohalocapsa sp. PB-PSB1]|nr:MAG: hypothetical protein N838_08525 [Thiohalocapsa sp. PB-PSB1]